MARVASKMVVRKPVDWFALDDPDAFVGWDGEKTSMPLEAEERKRWLAARVVACMERDPGDCAGILDESIGLGLRVNAKLSSKLVQEGVTLLHMVAMSKQGHARGWMDLLVSRGGDPKKSFKGKEGYGPTAFGVAASHLCPDARLGLAFHMLEKGWVDFSWKGKGGVSNWLRPFQMLRGGQIERMSELGRAMLESGANPMERSDSGKSALFFVNWLSNYYHKTKNDTVADWLVGTADMLISRGIPPEWVAPFLMPDETIKNPGMLRLVNAINEARDLDSVLDKRTVGVGKRNL